MANMTRPKMEIDGKTYEMELGVIERTMLGTEDHGIFTFHLSMGFGGSGQGAGQIVLDEPYKPRTDEFKRIGTAYGMDAIMRVLETVGVGSWEDLPGKHCYVLREDSYGYIRGIANQMKPEREYLVFEGHYKAFTALHGSHDES